MTDPVLQIMAMAKRLAGIELGEAKRSLVESRLAKRLRELGDPPLEDYVKRCERDPAEQEILLNQLTTNHTAWLREPAHFADFEGRVLPAIIRRQERAVQPKLRIWCAAAATGEEPYTIALCLVRALKDLDRWDAAVLCTDLSTKALALAKAGIYDDQRIDPLSEADRKLAVQAVAVDGQRRWQVRPALRQLLEFARLNLMEDWPMKGPFDVIFCRNVMIYFNRETQARLVNRLAGLLRPGGTLYVGHSESLSAINHPLRARGPAIYDA